MPVSAIVTGLPGGVIEKNRDARLLSPAALSTATLGRRGDDPPHRSRDRQGARAGGDHPSAAADGGVVLQTAEGVEALRCSRACPRSLRLRRRARRPVGASRRCRSRPISPRAATVTVTLVLSRHRVRLAGAIMSRRSPPTAHARPVRLADAGQRQSAGVRAARVAGGRRPLNREAANDTADARSAPRTACCTAGRWIARRRHPRWSNERRRAVRRPSRSRAGSIDRDGASARRRPIFDGLRRRPSVATARKNWAISSSIASPTGHRRRAAAKQVAMIASRVRSRGSTPARRLSARRPGPRPRHRLRRE